MATARHKVETYPQGFDTTLLLSVLLLTGIGIVMVYSASSAIATNSYGNGYLFIKKQALSSLATGMMTLRQDGLRKVLAGLTTLEEVFRVT